MRKYIFFILIILQITSYSRDNSLVEGLIYVPVNYRIFKMIQSHFSYKPNDKTLEGFGFQMMKIENNGKDCYNGYYKLFDVKYGVSDAILTLNYCSGYINAVIDIKADIISVHNYKKDFIYSIKNDGFQLILENYKNVTSGKIYDIYYYNSNNQSNIIEVGSEYDNTKGYYKTHINYHN